MVYERKRRIFVWIQKLPGTARNDVATARVLREQGPVVAYMSGMLSGLFS
jgi:hypothetical protein